MKIRVVSLAAWALLVVATASCSSPAPTAEQTFDALVVGSPTPLALSDKGFLDNLDDGQQLLAVELESFWSTYNVFNSEDADSSSREVFLDTSDQVLRTIDTELERQEIDLFLTESADLRQTFAPYLGLWRTVYDALVEVRDGVDGNDPERQQQGADLYARQIEAVAQADFDRVARAVDQLDPETARQFLEAEGLNPADFGL